MTLPGQAGAGPGVDASSEAIPRPLLILLGLGAVTLVVAGLREGAWLIAPAALGVVLVVTVAPIRGYLVRRGAPVWVGVLAVLVLVYLILVILVVSVVGAGAKLAELIPQYTSQMNDLVGDVTSALSSLGLQKDQVQAAASSLDLGKLAGALTGIAGDVFGMLSNLVFIAILVLFIGIDSSRFPKNLFAARGERPNVVDALTAFVHGTRTYLTVSAIFGFIVAVIDTVALALLGIPGAFVWGVLAFVTNFIPNIGFVIGVVPPALLALLDSGWQEMVLVLVVYSVLNVTIQTFIQPHFVGDAVGLSTSATFLSLGIWTFVLGPLGALLAVPATLLVRAILVDPDPRAGWAYAFIGSTPPPPAPPPKAKPAT